MLTQPTSTEKQPRPKLAVKEFAGVIKPPSTKLHMITSSALRHLCLFKPLGALGLLLSWLQLLVNLACAVLH